MELKIWLRHFEPSPSKNIKPFWPISFHSIISNFISDQGEAFVVVDSVYEIFIEVHSFGDSRNQQKPHFDRL